MFWMPSKQYVAFPFERENDLEAAILEVESELFGPTRIYLDVKKKIGANGKTRNIPDGYLMDLSSKSVPSLYVVENELSSHDPMRHIAVQVLQFSLSFEASPNTVKVIIKDALYSDSNKWKKCEEYAIKNGYENVDYLLESMIFGDDKFRALVIIDECVDDLEKVLVSRFKFPVEIIILERMKSGSDIAYQFEPFLLGITPNDDNLEYSQLDPEEIDSVVVPAREDGFQSVFLSENRWYAVRLHSSMIPKLRYIAVYRVAPISAITHIAPIKSIEPWKDSGKYVITFDEAAKEIGPLKLVPKGHTKPLQGLRYTSRKRIVGASSLDQVF